MQSALKRIGAISAWTGVLLAIFSLLPSFVPGAMSVIGLALSLLSVVITTLSVRATGKRYFYAAVGITLFGVFLVNDGLRVWMPLDYPWSFKLVLYGISGLVIGGCTLITHKLHLRTNPKNPPPESGG